MHSALEIPEIVALIINCICEEDFSLLLKEEHEPQQKLKRRTLCSLTQTSKMWSQYAIREIWRELDSLWPLFRICSAFSKQKVDTRFCFLIDGPILPNELTIMKRYRSLVSSLLFPPSPFATFRRPFMHASVFRKVFTALEGEPLLPNLTSFEYDYHVYGDFSNEYLSMFINKTLHKFDYSLEKVNDVIILQNVQERAPGLTTLNIRIGEQPINTTDLYESIMLIPTLRKLKLVLSAHVCLSGFRAHPNLFELDLYCVYPWDENLRMEVDFSKLRLLRKLKLQGPSGLLKKLLPEFSSVPINDISLVIKASEKCHSLRLVRFLSPMCYILHDEDVKQMAGAWLTLEVLHIIGQPMNWKKARRPRATSFKALEYLATGCLALRSLCIPLSLSSHDILKGMQIASQRRMLYLLTEGVMIDDFDSSVPFIAKHLASLFPNIMLFRRNYNSPDPEDLKRWIEYWKFQTKQKVSI
ncbi:hypothetical protein BDQ17DRAFT_1420802 [Cyathus striatus]|nr:hypothetical protein BDQ17DRAFT_1420802 [Cyathus striatus]